jgi:hypothetical protein
MSRRTGKDRPSFVKCACGVDIPVKSGGGPLPASCQQCKDKRHNAARKENEKWTPPIMEQHDMTGWGLVELDYVELMRKERMELGCKFDAFRAAVHALARDMGLEMTV